MAGLLRRWGRRKRKDRRKRKKRKKRKEVLLPVPPVLVVACNAAGPASVVVSATSAHV